MLMRLVNRRVEICRMLHKKSEGAAHLAAVLYMDAIRQSRDVRRERCAVTSKRSCRSLTALEKQ